MTEGAQAPERQPGIEQGTYEVIRDRLQTHGRTLAAKAEALNGQRLEIFGSTQMSVLGNERVRTENNCVPCDILAVGGHLLLGYNVFLGLKRQTTIADVFSPRRFERSNGSMEFPAAEEGALPGLLDDSRFVTEFTELYRYYKTARLLTLRRIGDKILAVFQVGSGLNDVKAFRWAESVDGTLTYMDNQGERDHVFPPSHDFEWTLCTRDDHIPGEHPHVSILDQVFVETVGGDLTVKIEDNTRDGQGIYRELVDDADQSLDDAQIHYAKLGKLIAIKVLPYREQSWRYLVFNTLTKGVTRIDNIGQACVQLPEDHGIIFPGGYYLERGETKTFDRDAEGMQFERVVRSPNGEDVLYVFHRKRDGLYVLLPYNMIRKEVENPIHCHGYCLFEDGNMIFFRSTDEEPRRVHPMQIWQTPFTSDVYADRQVQGDTFLEKIGNADLVRGISDCLSIRRMTEAQAPTREIYDSLIDAATRVIDSYHWLGAADVDDLLATLKEVRSAAELVVDEFEKVQILRREAQGALGAAEDEIRELASTLRPDFWKQIDEFVDALSDLRRQRGKLITLRDVRYVDLARVSALEEQVAGHFDEVSEKAVAFLLEPEALAPYHARIAELETQIPAAKKVTETKPLAEDLQGIGDGLDLLTEIVGGLEIDDATVRTRILQGISEVMSQLNRTRALLQARRMELLKKEGVAEFAAQFNLLGQSVSGALALADTPEKCEEQLSRLMLQLEDLEGRFSEFDEYLEQLATKREEIYETLGTKKQQLLDQRQRRAQHMMQAIERILTGVVRRSATFSEAADLNAYFASDAMVLKVRDLAKKLRELGDSVKADEAESRLKSSREDAQRALRDRRDIFEDGASVLRLGKHRFSVNTQPLELTMVPREGGMALHLTGTGFYEQIEDPEFEATRPYWDQMLVSETPLVYRGEFLAATMLAAAEEGEHDLSLERVFQAILAEDGLLPLVREFASDRYEEGYERGVHDADAALILERVLGLYRTAGLLRFAPTARAAACLFWGFFDDDEVRARLARQAGSLARMRTAFRHSSAITALQAELAEHIGAYFTKRGLALHEEDARVAGRYLFEELGKSPVRFVTSGEAMSLRDAFLAHLDAVGAKRDFEEDLEGLEGDLRERHRVARAWLGAWVEGSPENAAFAPALPEAVALVLAGARIDRDVSSALGSGQVEGLLGQHPRIDGRRMEIRLDEFLGRLSAYRHEQVPGYRGFQRTRHAVLERERAQLRLEEFMPKVMSSFVRNKLINEVYLPVFGDNLAKQLGALGAAKRTDLMGMLLLISPPGYGKTTLMEYIANRLGLVFMKINGPALGHEVRSLDPDEAPNATARQEVEKLNLAFEMGNNVLLYLDDIQHTHPELLQKFISLCDAQRKIEGVWRGRTRTYDLRGKKFVVCMAGNPYTESGEKFQIPDMLANRADVYNLGDILGGRSDLFSLSYVENALTSSAILAQVATHGHADIYPLVRMAQGEEIPATELEHAYSQVELEELLSVLRKVLRVQEVILAVNQEYIASASMDDAFRTEPPFKLQGSYRNMNKLAEKIVPVMNEEELEALIADHYVGEAQTLTTGAEQNLLKLAELRGRMTDEQTARWDEIKGTFARQQLMGGKDDDPVTRVTGTLSAVSDRLDEIGTTIREAALAAEAADDVRAKATAEHATALAATAASARSSAADTRPSVGPEVGEHLAAALAPYLDKLSTAVTALSETKLDVSVVNTAPAHAQKIIERQVQLMEVGLLPVLRSIRHSMKLSNAVWERLDEVMKTLKGEPGKNIGKTTRTKKTVRPFKGPPEQPKRLDEK